MSGARRGLERARVRRVRRAIDAAFVITVGVLSAACARQTDDAVDTSGLRAGGDTAAMPTPPESSANQPPAGGTPTPPAASPATPSGRRPPERTPPSPPPSPPPQSGVATPPSTQDTARGVVAVVGAVPITEVVLRQGTERSVRLAGPLAREIGRASGADVWVSGRRVDARTIEVARYAVRTVDGVPAVTGLLTAEGDRLVLVDDAGRRHSIARPPEPLREHVGARVWITGDLSAAVNAYGVLRPRR